MASRTERDCDEDGNVLTRSSGLEDQTWTFEYDALSRVTKSYDPVVDPPEDRYTQYDYDDINRTLVVTDRDGTRTKKEFDALGRLIHLIENESGTDATHDTQTTYGYDGVRQTSITDHDGNTTSYVYDAALRLWQAIYPDSGDGHNVVEFQHDPAGNLTQRTDQRGIVTQYCYDDLHHLYERDYSGLGAPRVEEFDFDRAGRLLSARKVAGGGYSSQANFAYDRAGRIVSATQRYGGGWPYSLGYAYTVAAGDVHTDLTYHSGRVVTSTFDPRSRLAGVFDGLGNGVSWAFDVGNRRESALLSNGVVSSFAYDLDNRLEHIQHANDVGGVLDPLYEVNYGYDPVGNRLYKQDVLEQDRSEVYSYDQRHRLTSFGRGTIQFNEEGAASIATPTSDPDMPSHQNWMPIGTTGLDSRGNWMDFTSTKNGQTATQTRTLDEAGGGGGCANEYDRVNMVLGNGHTIQQLTYDEAGNLVASDLLGDMNCDGLVNSFDVDPFIMALTNPSGYAATYPDCMIELGDLNGDGLVNTGDLNLFTDVLGDNLLAARRYVYDEENRLTAVTDIDGHELLTIEYDALGRRIASTEHAVATDPCTGDPGPLTVQTRHIYSGLNTVAEYISCDAGENWGLGREFLWGNRFPEPLVMIDYTAAGDVAAGTEEVLHYVHDALGSVVGLADAGDAERDPKLVERYDYDPYGKTYIDVWAGGSETWIRTTASAYGNPFGWTGQRYDAGVGMYHFPFRSYSPELGRWMQRDPLGYVDGANVYAYAASMAARLTDPLGLLLRDEGGNIVVTHDANPKTGYIAVRDEQGQVVVDDSGQPMIALVEEVTIYTDDGTPVTAYVYISGNPGALTDCHGVTFADGQLWVNNQEVGKILEDDKYALVDQLSPSEVNDVTGAQVGDILVYYDENGNVVHSVTVYEVDEFGRVSKVIGEGGWQNGESIHGIVGAWPSPWSFVRIYRPNGFWNYPYIYRDVMLREAIRWWANLFEQMMRDNWIAEARRWGHWADPPGPCD